MVKFFLCFQKFTYDITIIFPPSFKIIRGFWSRKELFAGSGGFVLRAAV